MDIARVQSLIEQMQKQSSQQASGQAESSNVFADLLRETSALSNEAGSDAEKFLATGEGELHDVQIKMAKADIAFRFLVEVRNRLADAYQEISRLNV